MLRFGLLQKHRGVEWNGNQELRWLLDIVVSRKAVCYTLNRKKSQSLDVRSTFRAQFVASCYFAMVFTVNINPCLLINLRVYLVA